MRERGYEQEEEEVEGEEEHGRGRPGCGGEAAGQAAASCAAVCCCCPMALLEVVLLLTVRLPTCIMRRVRRRRRSRRRGRAGGGKKRPEDVASPSGSAKAMIDSALAMDGEAARGDAEAASELEREIMNSRFYGAGFWRSVSSDSSSRTSSVHR